MNDKRDKIEFPYLTKAGLEVVRVHGFHPFVSADSVERRLKAMAMSLPKQVEQHLADKQKPCPVCHGIGGYHYTSCKGTQ